MSVTKGAVEILSNQHNGSFLNIDLKPPNLIFCDNKSAVDLADSNASSKRMKHILSDTYRFSTRTDLRRRDV